MGVLWGGGLLAIDKETISQIKQNVNIVDVIGEVVDLSKAGKHYLGLCPFHNEKTPSFNVIEDKQFYHCFGCGRSGDVFKFIEEYRQVPFLESVRIIANKAGMTADIPTIISPVKKSNPNQNLIDIHKDAAKFYQAVLTTTKEGQKAKQYLYSRGLTDDVITHFGIGLSPKENDFLYQSLSKKYDQTDLLKSGLFNLSEQSNQIYDAFKNRIMFPLTNDTGDVIAFSGRIWTLEDQDAKLAKYKNSRSTSIFNKSYEFYHLDRAKQVARKQKEIFLMEGFMDVIAAYRSGIENAVASMGTALTVEHVNHLRKITNKVIITYDGDSAGQNAIAKAIDILKGLDVEIVKIPNNMDPDEYIQKNSIEALVSLLTHSRISSTEFYIDYFKPENLDNLQAEIAYVEKLSPIIAQTPSITAQNLYISKVADLLPDFDYLQVENAVNQIRLKNRSERQTQLKQEKIVVELPRNNSVTGLLKAELQLFQRLLNHEFLLNEYRNKADFYFDTKELQTLYSLLKSSGDITAYDLAQFDDDVRRVYYQSMEENLPDDIHNGEIEEIERRIAHYKQERDLKNQGKQVRESSHNGDVDLATELLENLIAQKRKME